jgi:hypothetical protein
MAMADGPGRLMGALPKSRKRAKQQRRLDRLVRFLKQFPFCQFRKQFGKCMLLKIAVLSTTAVSVNEAPLMVSTLG